MAITVYRSTDRIKIKIHDVELIVKPLSYFEKSQVEGILFKEGGVIRENSILALAKLIKYSIKEISGVNNLDGTPYQLSFDADGSLLESSIDELMNMGISNDLTIVLFGIRNSIPNEIVGVDGTPLKHIQITPFDGSGKKK